MNSHLGKTLSDSLRRFLGSGDRHRAPARRRGERAFRLEALEGRALLTSVVFADGFGSGGTPAPTTAEAVVTDAGGATYITGGFSGTVTFGNLSLTSKGSSNIYVAKLNPSGTVAWVHRMGGSSQFFGDYGRSIALDSAGNVYVTGYFYGNSDFGQFNLTGNGARDIFVEKLDIAGNQIWAKNFGGTGSDLGQSITVDNQGNLYVTGSFQNTMTVAGTTLTSNGFNDGLIMKLDNSGNAIWAKAFGSAGDDTGYSVAVDNAGNVYSTGDFSRTVSFGNITLTSHGSKDAYVMKQDTSGNILWVKDFGGAQQNDGLGIALSGPNTIYITGDFTNQATFGGTTLTAAGTNSNTYDARLDASGNVIWAKAFGNTSQSAGFYVATDSSGNVYNTGFFQGTVDFGGQTVTSNGGTDAYLAKFDPNGNTLSALSIGGTQNDQGLQVSVGGPNQNITLVGDYVGAVNVGNVALPSTGTAFVAQYSQATIRIEPPSDFLNLGYTQPAMYDPSNANWLVTGPNGVQNFGPFGTANFGDIPVPGDYNGIGHTELAAFRPSTSQWFAQDPRTGTFLAGTFGAPNLYDIPIPGDYDGAGHTQLAVFRPTGFTAQWYVLRGNGGQLLASFGAPNLYDLPVPGDYDGTGHSELAVFRPTTAQWFILRPNGGQHLATFGGQNYLDIPIPGDWDHVGHTEPAVFRPSTGQIFVLGANGGHLLTTMSATNYSQIPVQTSIASLLRLGIIKRSGGGTAGQGSGVTPAAPGGGASAPSAAFAGGSAGNASTSSAVNPGPVAGSASTTRPSTSAVAPSAPLGVRSSVVIGQGNPPTTMKTDLVASAIDDLFGSLAAH